jgi:uncharacterized protein YgiB involved in biofilm formation
MALAMKTKFYLQGAACALLLLLLPGCGDDDKEQAVKSYKTVEECKADVAADATDEEKTKIVADCQKAFDQATADPAAQAPHYQLAQSCYDLYGEAGCGYAPGGYYYPFMNGFMFGYYNGVMAYHPYYYNRWGVVYSGSVNLGYFRGGYVMAPPGATWTRSYAYVPVARGAVPPPASSMRGVLGGTATRAASGVTVNRPSVSMPASPAARAPSVSTPSVSARGGFGTSAGTAGSSAGG